jgi:uncharacterized protein (DUF1800 family)
VSEVAIALNRFGLGARPDDIAPADPHGWLEAQIARYQPGSARLASVPTSVAVAADIRDYRDEQRMLRQQAMAKPATPAVPPMSAPPAGMAPPAMTMAMPTGAPAVPPSPATAKPEMREARQAASRLAKDDYTALAAARADLALGTDTPFAERLVHFWSNHFAVSADKLELLGLAGTLEMEAIRPHVMGRFSDMLFAVERHPAMLLYLDQSVSIGPDSPLGLKLAARGKSKAGLNENLAREIMELHTLGVRTGYTQADVTEFARAMTGWTVSGIGGGPGGRFSDPLTPGGFMFVDQVHQPGPRTILRKTYPAGGRAQAEAVLSDLSVHPATARHIATKLARHFIADAPPPAAVGRLEAAFLRSGGDLPTVYRALIASPEAWAPQPAKFKTPWEWSVSAWRAIGTRTIQPGAVQGMLDQLGQPLWKPGQPIGYDDTAPSWAGPDAILRRVEAAQRFAASAPAGTDARALAVQLFPGALSPATAQALQRAESPNQAIALLLVSPEMMRR